MGTLTAFSPGALLSLVLLAATGSATMPPLAAAFRFGALQRTLRGMRPVLTTLFAYFGATRHPRHAAGWRRNRWGLRTLPGCGLRRSYKPTVSCRLGRQATQAGRDCQATARDGLFCRRCRC